MSRPWVAEDVLLLGHSQMEGLAPFLTQHLHDAGAGTVHVFAERGTNVRRLRRERYLGLEIVPPSLADQLRVVLVALSGNGAVTDPAELRANMDWLRAEYPRALLVWLGHTTTRTDTDADAERARAAALEARVVPADPHFLWVDMRLPSAPLAPDGIHHTREGYRQLAAHAWAQILDGTREASGVGVLPVVVGGLLAGVLAAFGARAIARRRARRENLDLDLDLDELDLEEQGA
ncbi:MAG: hypothetical protein KC619_04940 [Myxococcales bacterium]|nr:hypothetical protein [Myxococcales bacterium]